MSKEAVLLFIMAYFFLVTFITLLSISYKLSKIIELLEKR